MVIWIYLRNVTNGSIVFDGVSVCQLLPNQNKSDIYDVVLRNGIPLVTTSSEETWMYHGNMKSWMLVNDHDRALRIESSRSLGRMIPSVEQIEVFYIEIRILLSLL